MERIPDPSENNDEVRFRRAWSEPIRTYFGLIAARATKNRIGTRQ